MEKTKSKTQSIQSLNTLLGVHRDSGVSFGGIVKDQESMTYLSNFHVSVPISTKKLTGCLFLMI